MYFTKKQLENVFYNILLEHDIKTSVDKCEKIFKQFFDDLEEILIQNPKGLMFGNLGKFKTVLRKKRKGFNIKTKQTISIPAKYVLTFKASQSFKNKLLERLDLPL